MMSPEMMAQAQQMMSKMSPEDIQRMQEMTRNMDPAQLRAMQQQMMSNPAAMQQAQQAMASMSPDQLKQQMDMASQQFKSGAMPPGMPTMAAPAPKGAADALRASARGIPPGVISMVDEAEKFKEAGNKRFKAGDYDGAVAKYDAALGTLRDCKYESELTGADLTAVHTLADACLLNGANCHLKKKTYERAIEGCETVLARSSTNRKALYRRGQAYLGQGKLQDAVTDLKAAYAQDRSDTLVAGTLREARQKLKEEGGAEAEGIDDDDDDTDDEMPALEEVKPSGSAAARSSSAPPMGGMGPMDAAAAQQAMANMSPEQMRAQMEAVANMDPELLKSLDPRMKDMDPAMLKASLDAVKNMSPEQMAEMQKMAASGQMPMPGGMGGMPGGAAAAGMAGKPGAGPDMASMMQNMSPEMISSATSMMRNMDPEQMAKMMSSMGKEISTEQAKQMQEQLNKVSPETMELWTGRAMRAYKAWTWLKSGAVAWFTEPRRAATSLARAGGLEQLVAVLTALLAMLVVGHLTNWY